MIKKLKTLTAILFSLVLSALFLTACFSGNNLNGFENEAGGTRTINVGFEGGICQAPIAIAHLKGFFADEGLNTTLRVTGDLVTTRNLLAAGEIDVAAGMLAGWFMPMVAGVDVRISMGLHTGCASMFVRSSSNIYKINQLVSGQRIFASGLSGSAFHNIGRRFIYRADLSDDDVVWLNGTAGAGVAALLEGDVDVAVLPDQTAQRLIDSGEFRRIRSLDDDDFKYEACCVVVMMGNFMGQNPITAAKITRAIFRAARWLDYSTDNKISAVTSLIDANLFSGPADIVEYTVNLLSRWQWGLPHSQTEATLDVSIGEYRALDLIGAHVNLNAFKAHIWQPVNLDGVTDFNLPNEAANNINASPSTNAPCCA